MTQWRIALFLVLFGLPLSLQAQSLEDMPGYVDFGALDEVYGEPRVMINIGGVLMTFMAAAASHEDPQAAALMRNLDGVRVNVYDTAGVMTPALEQIKAVRVLLQQEGWEPVVQVKEDGEEVQIFMKANEEGMQGLTVMTVNLEEAVFINVLGEIDPAQLNAVMDNLNIDLGNGGQKAP